MTNRTATWNGPTIPLNNFQAGRDYNLSVWVKLASGTDRAILSVKRTDGDGDSFINVATAASATSNAWTKLEGVYSHRVAGNLDTLTAYVEGPAIGADYYVDDFVATAGPLTASSSSSSSSSSSTTSSSSGGRQFPKFFVGNITTRGAVRSDFGQYWKQITPENEGKWGSVEGTRDQYNWAPLDRIYQYGRMAGIPVKAHTFVWGAQAPTWATNNSVSATDMAVEIEEWIRDYCTRYPDTAIIDVVNEAVQGHQPAAYAQRAFGNNWIIKSFQLARKYCPNSILVLNDYNTFQYQHQQFIDLAKPVIASGYVDAVGMQSHDLTNYSAVNLKARLDNIYNELKVPIYITEYDIGLTNDQQQLQNFQAHFPVFYAHPAIKGITVWGYVEGSTWIEGSGLLTANGTARPSMTWLQNYIKSNPK